MSAWLAGFGLNKLFRTDTESRTKRINRELEGLPQSTKEIVIGRIIAIHLPARHIHRNPQKLVGTSHTARMGE
jgi:hypothetical protein